MAIRATIGRRSGSCRIHYRGTPPSRDVPLPWGGRPRRHRCRSPPSRALPSPKATEHDDAADWTGHHSVSRRPSRSGGVQRSRSTAPTRRRSPARRIARRVGRRRRSRPARIGAPPRSSGWKAHPATSWRTSRRSRPCPMTSGSRCRRTASGTQCDRPHEPRRREVPSVPESSITTSSPRSTSRAAATAPDGPLPMTTTGSSDMPDVIGRLRRDCSNVLRAASMAAANIVGERRQLAEVDVPPKVISRAHADEHRRHIGCVAAPIERQARRFPSRLEWRCRRKPGSG